MFNKTSPWWVSSPLISSWDLRPLLLRLRKKVEASDSFMKIIFRGPERGQQEGQLAELKGAEMRKQRRCSPDGSLWLPVLWGTAAECVPSGEAASVDKRQWLEFKTNAFLSMT